MTNSMKTSTPASSTQSTSTAIIALRILFLAILATMLDLTIWSSLDKSVWDGFHYLFQDRWAIATLGDAYCGFITFLAWLVYREKSNVSRVLWVLFVLVFGNIAMSIYVLNRLRTAKSVEDLLVRPHEKEL
jgi:uncharacterized membrane protein YczE